ncbi:MAG: hypothetical protein AAF577_15540 [Pseudomonadota bacterium]
MASSPDPLKVKRSQQKPKDFCSVCVAHRVVDIDIQNAVAEHRFEGNDDGAVPVVGAPDIRVMAGILDHMLGDAKIAETAPEMRDAPALPRWPGIEGRAAERQPG